MPNPGQPTISAGATGDAVRVLQRALRRSPIWGFVVDGVFGPKTELAVKDIQQSAGLTVDGVVGPQTWAALPNGAPMPRLQEGSTLSIRQPWAELIVSGLKKVENRSWSTHYRGPVLIHAALRPADTLVEDVEKKFAIRIPRDLPRGGVVGIAGLAGVVTVSGDNHGYEGECGKEVRCEIELRGA